MSQRIADDLIQRAAEMISTARYCVAFTGAGISTPSGIPDFRSSNNGLWQRYDPMRVASLSAFHNNPSLFFEWFRPLFMTSWQAKPNAAHMALATLETKGLLKAVITQNIDALHQKAGSEQVFELHGTCMTFTCPNCGFSESGLSIHKQFTQCEMLPHCSECDGVLKPNVVLFEEALPLQTWMDAENEIQKSDLLLVIGSSLEVQPAATLPLKAHAQGSRLIINNLSGTPLDYAADLLIHLDAAEFLPQLIEKLSEKRSL